MPIPRTGRVNGALPGAGSSGIHRRVVHFISPGRGRMGRTDRGLLIRIVLREALAARTRLRPPTPYDRGHANFRERRLAELRRITLPRRWVNIRKLPLVAYEANPSTSAATASTRNAAAGPIE